MTKSCNACGNNILNNEFIECVKCDKHYDLLCLNLKKDGWKKMSQRVKDKWLCPSCSCSRPKTDNSATPARTTATTADEEQTDAFNVNTTRGTKLNPKSWTETPSRRQSRPRYSSSSNISQTCATHKERRNHQSQQTAEAHLGRN